MSYYHLNDTEYTSWGAVEDTSNLLYPGESYKILGAAFEVYKTLGSFLREKAYQKGFARELELQGIPFVREQYLPLFYKGTVVQNILADFVVYDKIVVEIKALPETGEKEFRQVHDYLIAGNYDLGILLNFGTPGQIEKHRIVRKGAGFKK